MMKENLNDLKPNFDLKREEIFSKVLEFKVFMDFADFIQFFFFS